MIDMRRRGRGYTIYGVNSACWSYRERQGVDASCWAAEATLEVFAGGVRIDGVVQVVAILARSGPAHLTNNFIQYAQDAEAKPQ